MQGNAAIIMKFVDIIELIAQGVGYGFGSLMILAWLCGDAWECKEQGG